MLDFIFGFDRQMENRVRWSFNLNHLLLVFSVAALAILLYKILPYKDKKSIVKVKLSLIFTMLILEVSRIIWKILRHLSINDSLDGFNWARTISFTMCAINVWITIGVIIATIFVKYDNKGLVIFKNILYGSALLGGIAMFIYPENLDHNGHWHIFHFVNLQTILQHLLLAFVPIYLIKSGELKVRLKNIWMPLLGLLGAYTIIVVASHVVNHNFTFALRFAFGNIQWPLHKIVMGIVAFSLMLILYIPFEILYKNKQINSKLEESKNEIKKTKLLVIDIIAISLLFVSTVFGPLLLGASEGYAIDSPIALILIIPLILLIFTIIVTTHLNKKEQLFI